MNNKIRKASHSDTDRLAVSLARAFDDDPIINWLVRKDKKGSWNGATLSCLHIGTLTPETRVQLPVGLPKLNQILTTIFQLYNHSENIFPPHYPPQVDKKTWINNFLRMKRHTRRGNLIFTQGTISTR